MASPNDRGLRVASFKLKVGLRTVITKFGKFGFDAIVTQFKIGKFGPYATATQLKFGMFGSCTITASSKFGPCTGSVKFGLRGPGSVASTSFSGLASFKLDRVASTESNQVAAGEFVASSK